MEGRARASARAIDGAGRSSGDVQLPDELFGGEVNVPLMHQVVTAQLAAARAGTASTKKRSEVRGGGAKPWRQKGTGRARHGSSRSPIWVGGGVVFGPKPRDYSQRVNKKMKRAALRGALADKAASGRIWILDEFNETKTKAATALLAAAGIEGRVLLVLDPGSEGDVLVDRAFRNLPNVAFSLFGALAVYDVLVADALVFTRTAFERFVSGREEVSQAEEVSA